MTNGKTNSRITIPFHVDLADSENREIANRIAFSDKSLANDLITEVKSGVVPWTTGDFDSPLSVEVRPNLLEEHDILTDAFGRERPIEDAVITFLRDSIGTIMIFGSACFEVVYDLAALPSGKRAFAFEQIPPGSLIFRPDHMPEQRIPAPIVQALNVPKRLPISRSHLVILEPPSEYEEHIRTAIERLAILSEPIFPGFVENELRAGTNTVQFDSALYARNKALAIASATKPLGWGANLIYGASNQRVPEHYFWIRNLQFLRFCAQFRNTLLETINNGLDRIASTTGFKASIALLGFPTMQEIDNAISDFQQAQCSIEHVSDLMKRARGW